MKSNPSGAWRCPTCGFVLMKRLLDPESGRVGVNRELISEKCPNDGATMKAVPLDDMGLLAPGRP